MPQTVVNATVLSIQSGRHGRFVVAVAVGFGSVTFALSKEVWGEEDEPSPGEIVMLSRLREMQKGWRAMKAWRNTPPQQQ